MPDSPGCSRGAAHYFRQPERQHERHVFLLDRLRTSQDDRFQLATELRQTVQAYSAQRTGRPAQALPSAHAARYIRRRIPSGWYAPRRGIDNPGPFVRPHHGETLHAVGSGAAGEPESVGDGVVGEAGKSSSREIDGRSDPAARGGLILLLDSLRGKRNIWANSQHLTTTCCGIVGMRSFLWQKKSYLLERRPQGDYAVRRGGAERASAVEPTQAEAIERAKEINNGGPVLVEHVRNTDVGHRDKWRKP